MRATRRRVNETLFTRGLETGEDFIETFQGKESKPTDISNLLERLYNDEYDFVAIGRALISNPDWAKLVRNEEYEKIKIFTPKDLEELI